MLCWWREFLFSCIIVIMCKFMFGSLFVTLQTKHSQRMNVWPDLLCLRSSVSPGSPGVPPARWASAAHRGAPAELPQLRDAPPAGMPERQTVPIKSFDHNPSKVVKHSSIYRHHHKTWNASILTFELMLTLQMFSLSSSPPGSSLITFPGDSEDSVSTEGLWAGKVGRFSVCFSTNGLTHTWNTNMHLNTWKKHFCLLSKKKTSCCFLI